MPFRDQITDTFLAYDFKPKRKPPHFQQAFVRGYDTKLGIFQVQFTEICSGMTHLPKAYLLSVPEPLRNRVLPDINADKSICYLDTESTNLFPLDPCGSIATCIALVEKLIQIWVSDESHEELQAEFSSYWQPEYPVFNISTKPAGIYCTFERTNLAGNICVEIVQADTEKEAIAWLESRGGRNPSKFCPALTQNISQKLYVPQDMQWPADNLKEFLCWVSAIDPTAYQALIGKLVAHVCNNKKIILCIKQESEVFSAQIEFTDSGLKVLERARGSKKITSRKNGYKLTQLVAALSGKLMTKSFKRLWVEDASSTLLFQRNQPNQNTLSNKRIALIGCGTIGGYTAQVLTQCGAGAEQGSIHLFDDDILNTGNLGRHLLGKKYLLELKSQGLKHFLDSQGLPVSIVAQKKFNEEDIRKPWDLIIDATGSDTFSVLLASWYRKHEPTKTQPTLIHGWVDAYGKAARVLKDDRSGACYCCMSTYQGNDRSPRFPLFADGKAPNHNLAFRRQCGRTYMPFSSQPSLAAAGLIQSMALTTDKKREPTFRQLSFSSDVQRAKDQILKPVKGCPVCSKQS